MKTQEKEHSMHEKQMCALSKSIRNAHGYHNLFHNSRVYCLLVRFALPLHKRSRRVYKWRESLHAAFRTARSHLRVWVVVPRERIVCRVLLFCLTHTHIAMWCAELAHIKKKKTIFVPQHTLGNCCSCRPCQHAHFSLRLVLSHVYLVPKKITKIA